MRGWAPSPSFSPCTLFLFSFSPSGQRGGEDSQGVGQKTEAAFSQLFLCLFLYPLLSLPLLCVSFISPNFCTLSFGVFSVTDTLSLLSKAWKQSSPCHTHTLLFLLMPLPLPQSRGKVALALSASHSVFFSPLLSYTPYPQRLSRIFVFVRLSDPAKFLPDVVVIRMRARGDRGALKTWISFRFEVPSRGSHNLKHLTHECTALLRICCSWSKLFNSTVTP